MVMNEVKLEVEWFAITSKKATIIRSQALGIPYILLSKDNYIRKL